MSLLVRHCMKARGGKECDNVGIAFLDGVRNGFLDCILLSKNNITQNKKFKR